MSISVDFESYSEVNILYAGAYVYAAHESTRLLCAVFHHELIGYVSWLPEQPLPAFVRSHIESKGVLHAFNAGFERVMWNVLCTKLYNWPATSIEQWRCSAAAARAMATPNRLDHVAQFLRLPEQKDAPGKRVMQKLSKPDRKGNMPVATPEEQAALLAYCKQDVATEIAVQQAVRRLSKKEQLTYEQTERINEKGIYVDVELAKAAKELWDAYTPSLNAELARITSNYVTAGTQVQRIKEWLGRNVPPDCFTDIRDPNGEFNSLDKEAMARLVKSPKLSQPVRQVVKLRQQMSGSALKKYDSFINASGVDGRIRGTLMYHGASTGRAAGKLLQPQNMMRPSIKKEDVPLALSLVKSRDLLSLVLLFRSVNSVLGSLTRAGIRPKPGCRLIVADYNAIEARVTAWLAQQMDLLSDFVNKRDPYRRMASAIYGIPVPQITDKQRFYGKQVTLGCGYGMGHIKFQRVCEQYGEKISIDFATRCVSTYRADNQKIVALWNNLNHAAVTAVKEQTITRVGFLQFYTERINNQDWLFMRLPSGRDLAYCEPEIAAGKFGGEQVRYRGVDSQSGLPKNEYMYGGKWLENASQATARDILTEAGFRLEARRYQVVANVHDELLLEVPLGFGSVKEVETIMAESVKWAPGLPISVEGWEGDFYWKS